MAGIFEMLFDAFWTHEFVFCKVAEKVEIGLKIIDDFLFFDRYFEFIGIKDFTSVC